MCFEKPPLWWLLETYVAFRRLWGDGAASTRLYATYQPLCTAPIFGHELVTLVGDKTPAQSH